MFFFQLIFLKIAQLLFPTSDYRHPVSTPTFQWMSQVLSTAKFFTRPALASGLMVATFFTEVSSFQTFKITFSNFMKTSVTQIQLEVTSTVIFELSNKNILIKI